MTLANGQQFLSMYCRRCCVCLSVCARVDYAPLSFLLFYWQHLGLFSECALRDNMLDARSCTCLKPACVCVWVGLWCVLVALLSLPLCSECWCVTLQHCPTYPANLFPPSLPPFSPLLSLFHHHTCFFPFPPYPLITALSLAFTLPLLSLPLHTAVIARRLFPFSHFKHSFESVQICARGCVRTIP